MTGTEQTHEAIKEARPRPNPGWAAAAGVVAGALALGVGELLAGVSRSIPSLVVSVGDVIVDMTPLGIVRLSIKIFGTNDKPALLIGIVVTALAIAALLGVLAASRRWIGVAGFALFGFLGAAAGMRDPMVSDLAAIAVAVAASGAGIAALFWLLGILEILPTTVDEAAVAGDRRRFIFAAISVATVAVASAALGRLLGARTIVEAARSTVELPTAPTVPTASGSAISAATIPGLSPLFTPNDVFYRIDTALQVPQVDPATWRLRFTGMVDNPYELTFDELLAMPLVDEAITLCCVSNQVGGNLIGNAVWTGVPLLDLLGRAGVQPGATQVVGASIDDFTVGFPTDVLDGERPALVAVGMNGEPLPAAHGFPARLVVSGLYGYVSATKWLTEVHLTTLEEFDAYWIPRGWAKEAPVKTQSRIDTPRPSHSLVAGTIPIAGVAWAQSRDISKVEVRIDDGPWVEAELGERVSEHTWRQWVHRWDAEPGRHRLVVRATDGTGETQTAEMHGARPDGATGYHHVTVDVADA